MELDLTIANCKECTLPRNPVIGRGSNKPKIIFVGEAPGAEEDKQGVPFVGRAGQVLTSVINYLHIPEEDYYLTNVCMCRPPENRTPTAEEINCCFPVLMKFIQEVNPDIVVALGSTPLKALFGSDKKISNDRGKLMKVTETNIKGIATYHPAATLYAKGDTLFPFVLGDIQKALDIVNGKVNVDTKNMETEVFIVDTDEKMDRLVDRLICMASGTVISFDWETTGLSPLWDCGFCLGLSWAEGTAAVIPIRILRKQIPYLSSALSDKRLIGFNAVGFDAAWNTKYGLPNKVDFDPMLWHYMIDERPQQRSLENLSSFYLNAPCYESEMMAQYKTNKQNMITTIPEEVVMEYCGKDVDWTLRLSNYFNDNMSEEDHELMWVYQNLIHEGARTFADIKAHGVWVDQETLNEVDKRMTDEIVIKLQELQNIISIREFNPNSHKQVQEALWDILKLEQPDLYGRKDRSSDKTTLEALQEAYPDQPFVSTLRRYRELFTLYSRYVRELPRYIEPDGRVRANYHFDRTETGRLSTTNPAIHQIPRDGTIRSIFSAPPEHVLVQADYEQIEIRMAAHVAQDTELTDLLKSGVDFHTLMASKAFKVPVEEVTKDQRQAAKTVSFGLLYLMSDKGLAVRTGLPKDEAHEFVASYKKLMPGVQSWIEKTKEDIRTKQYIKSPFGRRRRFPFVTNSNIEGLYKEGVNFPIQSGASDVTLRSVLRLHSLFKVCYPEAHIVITVHDSIIVECPEIIAEEVAKKMKEVMEDVPSDVPFPVDIKIGRCWGEY